jgi:hypothetical protein
MRPPLERRIEVRIAPDGATRSITFAGSSLEVKW